MSTGSASTGTRLHVAIAVLVVCVVAFTLAQRNLWFSARLGHHSEQFLDTTQPWKSNSNFPLGRKFGRNGNSTATILTRADVLKIAPDGVLLLTMANHHFMGFVRTWLYQLRQLAITSYLIGTLDNQLYDELTKQKINCFNMGANLPTHDFGRGKTFYSMGTFRVRQMMMFLEMDINIIFADIDAMWIQNPIPYWKRYWRADMLVATDSLVESHVDGGLDDPMRVGAANIGVLMAKPSTLGFMKKWLEVLVKDPDYWEQRAFDNLLNTNRTSSMEDPDRLFIDVNGTFLTGFLPITQFHSGQSYFIEHMDRKWHMVPYTIHTTYQLSGGTPGKVHRLRDSLVWDDLPEYFDRPNGYLAYDPDIPQDLLDKAGPTIPGSKWLNNTLGHFELMNHQLTQIRNALSIAHVLNRTLVIPEIWCGFSKFWEPHAGRAWNSQQALPFQCPLDNLLNTEFTAVKEGENGDIYPFIEIKESSYFYNRRLPDSVKRSALRVQVCDKNQSKETGETSKPGEEKGKGEEEGDGCGKDDDYGGNGLGRIFGKMLPIDNNPSPPVFQLAANLTDVKIREAFADKNDTKILYFSSMLNSFGGFESEGDSKVFEEGTRDYTDGWCCAFVEDNGTMVSKGVVYDLFHDVIPHTDRLGRVFNKTWEPLPF